MSILIFSNQNYLLDLITQLYSNDQVIALNNLEQLPDFNSQSVLISDDYKAFEEYNDKIRNHNLTTILLLPKSDNYILDLSCIYLYKPIKITELKKVIDSYLHRYNHSKVIKINGFELDIIRKIIIIDQEEIEISEKEILILDLLYQNKDKELSKTELLKMIWSYDQSVESHTLETHIYRIRKKIGANTIITGRNGYKLGPS